MELTLVRVKQEEVKQGDVFVWQSSKGELETHTFHSDAGYGVKTYTDYNEENGSSVLVNWSGVCGIIKVTQ